MTTYKHIGTISECRRRFEWRIDHFMRLLDGERSDLRLSSVEFEFALNRWCLEILPNVGVEDPRSAPWVELRLFRKYCRLKDHVRASIGIYRPDGTEREVCNRACLIPEGESDWGKVPLVEKRFMLLHHHQMLHGGQLAIFCYLSREPIIEDISSDEEEILDKQSCQLLHQDMLTMFEKGLHTDVIIKVGDCEFRAHQTVLSARSPVFHGMLANDMSEKNSGAVTISDCEPSAFHQFLYYVYTGKVQAFTVDTAISLFIAADKYDCPDLSEQCVEYLESNMTAAVVLEVLRLSSLLRNQRLHSSAIQFFSYHLEEVLNGEAWMEFLKENPVQANDIFKSALRFLEERNVFIV